MTLLQSGIKVNFSSIVVKTNMLLTTITKLSSQIIRVPDPEVEHHNDSVRLGWVCLGQVRSGQARPGQVR